MVKRIGVTIAYYKDLEKRLFCNGISQHVYLLYNFFKSLKEVRTFIISNDVDTKSVGGQIDYISISDIRKLKTLDYVIVLGLTLSVRVVNAIKDYTEIISWKLGNSYEMNMASYFYDYGTPGHDGLNLQYSRCWISPHFEYAKDFYSYLYSLEKIEVAPYVWTPYFTSKTLDPSRLVSLDNGIRIGVLESNIHLLKNCMYPFLICERLGEEIERAYMFCTTRIRKNKDFTRFVMKSEKVRSKRISFEDRYRFHDIVHNWCNVILSHQDNCALNFVYLECLYHGIPLVHNSEMIKEYGYYYERNDVEMAMKHIRDIKRSFNREEYIEKNRGAIEKFSVRNPEFRDFIQRQFELPNMDSSYNDDEFDETPIVAN